jgi:hypothetical protein
VESLFR